MPLYCLTGHGPVPSSVWVLFFALTLFGVFLSLTNWFGTSSAFKLSVCGINVSVSFGGGSPVHAFLLSYDMSQSQSPLCIIPKVFVERGS